MLRIKWLGKYKRYVTVDHAMQLIVVCLVISLFFNVKLPLIEDYAYFLGEKKDFLIYFAYISDVMLLCLLALQLTFLRGNRLKKELHLRALWEYLPFAIIVLAFSSHLSVNSKLSILPISIYILLFLAKSIVLHETILSSKLNLIRTFCHTFLIIVLFESLLAIYQFSEQKGLGLQLLGESIIGPYDWGVAKVEALGQVFLRSYGTFPHPNILAGFLLLGILVGIYYALFEAKSRLAYFAFLGIVHLAALALLLTFSRAAWMSAVLVFCLSFIFTWNIKGLKVLKSKVLLTYVSIGAMLFVVGLILLPLIQQRGNVFDKAYQERKSYNVAAMEMIRENPFFGIGPSESLLHMEQSLGVGIVEPWEVQPIHNYYLLLGAEIGIPALVFFLIYLSISIKNSIRVIRSKISSPILLFLFAGLIGFLVLMLFDHYFYTFQPAALLFWMWLAFLIREVAHETDAATSIPNP